MKMYDHLSFEASFAIGARVLFSSLIAFTSAAFELELEAAFLAAGFFAAVLTAAFLPVVFFTVVFLEMSRNSSKISVPILKMVMISSTPVSLRLYLPLITMLVSPLKNSPKEELN